MNSRLNHHCCTDIFAWTVLECARKIITEDDNVLQVSNIADRGYLGSAAVLTTFGPLLKPHNQNPNATLLALYLNAVHEVFSPVDYLVSTVSEVERMHPYMQGNQEMLKLSNKSNADFLRFDNARGMFRDYDQLFDRYMRECRLREISKTARLIIKPKNTIVRPWPMRLDKNATQREFDILQASGHCGSERYMEWNRMA